jgi:predicted esterase
MRPFPRIPAIVLAALSVGVYASAAAYASDGPEVSPDKLVPDADLVIPLPNLGPSQHTFKDPKPEPVAMEVLLPTNYARQRPMPVLCVYNGDGGTGAPPPLTPWLKLAEHRNRIILTVGYEAVDWGANDQNFAHMHAALEALAQLTAIDRSDLTLAGDRGGAYLISDELANDRVFTRFLMVAGGRPLHLDARALGGRPAMIVAGGEDNDHDATDEPSRNEKEMVLADQLRHDGADVTLAVIKGMHHELAPAAYPIIRKWLGRTATNPDLRRAWLLNEELDSATLDSRRAWLSRELASSWVEMPNSADARAAAPDAPEPATAPAKR